MDIASRNTFPMEAQGDEDVLEIGRFVFSKSGFERATAIINNAIGIEGWLIIDEIGPLELKGEGFNGVLHELLAKRSGKTLLVIRDKDQILEKVLTTFRINDSIVIRSIIELNNKLLSEKNPLATV